MIEIERKFKFIGSESMLHALTPIKITQGYLMLSPEQHLRVRIYNDSKAVLGYKIFRTSTERSEYGWAIPTQEAKELLAGTNIKLEKTRYSTTYRTIDPRNRLPVDLTVDIDIYESINLKIVEIEFPDNFLADPGTVMLPGYCGEEITGISEFSNITIAKNHNKLV